MPIDPISWAIIIGSFVAGSAVGYFWDEIKEWASRMLGYILDAINKAIEVTSNAVVYLVKQGARIYKRIEVYVRNVYTNTTTLRYKEQEVAEVPHEINEQLKTKSKLKIAEQGT